MFSYIYEYLSITVSICGIAAAFSAPESDPSAVTPTNISTNHAVMTTCPAIDSLVGTAGRHAAISGIVINSFYYRYFDVYTLNAIASGYFRRGPVKNSLDWDGMAQQLQYPIRNDGHVGFNRLAAVLSNIQMHSCVQAMSTDLVSDCHG